MKEHGILFSSEMVRALLAGTKTQTRRLIRVDDTPIAERDAKALRYQRGIPSNAQNVRFDGYQYLKCDAPPGSATVSSRVMAPHQPQQILWCRETFADGYSDPLCVIDGVQHFRPIYRADAPGAKKPSDVPGSKVCADRWTPGIHMPRWASRITLRVTSVRVERVQTITEEDARAEGVDGRDAYTALWDVINGKTAPWASSPWVWVYAFERVQ